MLLDFFYTLREAGRHMAERANAGDPGGSLIVTGSLTVFCGVPGRIHYGAAKGAVAAMMKGVAVDLGKYGVRANMVAPGYIKTELNDAFFESDAGKALIKRVPQRRLGEAAELDGPLLLLASDAGAYMTGSVVAVDGGHLVSGL